VAVSAHVALHSHAPHAMQLVAPQLVPSVARVHGALAARITG
jgi:hypothetical protein